MPAVAFVVDSLDGGLGAAVASGTHWLTDHGWDVSVLAPPGSSGATALAGAFVPVDVPGTARRAGAMARCGRQVRRALGRLRPDLVHCHGLRSFAATRLLARRRSLLTLHGLVVAGAVADDPRGYHAVRRAGMALLPRLAVRAFSVAPGVPGYVFTPHASPLLATFDRLGPCAADAPFLWLGRLDVPKAPDDLVRAAAEALATAPALRVQVAGGGPMAADLAALVERLQAPVELLGERSDVVPLLEAARAVVLVSRAEGVPLSVVEAMWAGRAVVASRLPGTEWLAGGPGNGVTVVDDASDLVAALVRLSDPAVAAADGAAAADRIRSIMSPDTPWPDVERVYREVLDRG